MVLKQKQMVKSVKNSRVEASNERRRPRAELGPVSGVLQVLFAKGSKPK